LFCGIDVGATDVSMASASLNAGASVINFSAYVSGCFSLESLSKSGHFVTAYYVQYLLFKIITSLVANIIIFLKKLKSKLLQYKSPDRLL